MQQDFDIEPRTIEVPRRFAAVDLVLTLLFAAVAVAVAKLTGHWLPPVFPAALAVGSLTKVANQACGARYNLDSWGIRVDAPRVFGQLREVPWSDVQAIWGEYGHDGLVGVHAAVGNELDNIRVQGASGGHGGQLLGGQLNPDQVSHVLTKLATSVPDHVTVGSAHPAARLDDSAAAAWDRVYGSPAATHGQFDGRVVFETPGARRLWVLGTAVVALAVFGGVAAAFGPEGLGMLLAAGSIVVFVTASVWRRPDTGVVATGKGVVTADGSVVSWKHVRSIRWSLYRPKQRLDTEHDHADSGHRDGEMSRVLVADCAPAPAVMLAAGTLTTPRRRLQTLLENTQLPVPVILDDERCQAADERLRRWWRDGHRGSGRVRGEDRGPVHVQQHTLPPPEPDHEAAAQAAARLTQQT